MNQTMQQDDPIARLGILSAADRQWIVAGLSPRAREELLRLTRGAIGDAPAPDDASARAIGTDAITSVEPAIQALIAQLASLPVDAVADVLAAEPTWITATLLRVADWPWRAQLLQRLPHAALCLCPTLESNGPPADALVRSLLQRITASSARLPVPAPGRFESLVQKITARRIAALRSI